MYNINIYTIYIYIYIIHITYRSMYTIYIYIYIYIYIHIYIYTCPGLHFPSIRRKPCRMNMHKAIMEGFATPLALRSSA